MPKAESKYYLVLGRIPFDDEDSMLVTYTTSEKKAVAAFVTYLYSRSSQSKKEVKASNGKEAYITAIMCSDAPITRVSGPY